MNHSIDNCWTDADNNVVFFLTHWHPMVVSRCTYPALGVILGWDPITNNAGNIIECPMEFNTPN